MTPVSFVEHGCTQLSQVVITKITKLATSRFQISNGERRLINGERHLIIPNSIFVQSCDQIVSSFWSHDFTI